MLQPTGTQAIGMDYYGYVGCYFTVGVRSANRIMLKVYYFTSVRISLRLQTATKTRYHQLFLLP